MSLRLEMSIGPVQGFIQDSRRTRDLWGSSYLLAFLAAHAARGVSKAGGRIVRPLVDADPLFRWVTGQHTGEPPQMGSLPNHFLATVNEANANVVAQAGIAAIQCAWGTVCNAVWKRFVKQCASSGQGTAEIWLRQTSAFWEVTWAVGPSPSNSTYPPLARRKSWRSQHFPEEPGDKCTVMPVLQELSGHISSRRSGRKAQRDFWTMLRKRTGDFNVRDNERLSSIALVKRMFPDTGSEALGWQVHANRWPSTVNVAAVPWMRAAAEAAPGLAASYANEVREAALDDLSSLWVWDKRKLAAADPFSNIDAAWLHQHSLADPRRRQFSGNTRYRVREQLQRSLDVLQKAMAKAGRSQSPSSFYAVVLADGDRLGQLLGEVDAGMVSRALARFTTRVDDIVRKHDGVTVYAGGDDVLALLPVSTALSGAQAMAKLYGDAFDAEAKDDGMLRSATLSAGVAFSHYKMPLGQVINEAHRLLDDVAKDTNGRDSLAVAVLKPGGLHSEWVTTWRRDGGTTEAVDVLERMSKHLAEDESETGISVSLLYRLRQTLSRLSGLDQWRPGAWGQLPSTLDLNAFVRAELMQSLAARTGASSDRIGQLAELIRSLLGSARRDGVNSTMPEGGDESPTDVGFDALMLAQFLATGGRET